MTLLLRWLWLEVLDTFAKAALKVREEEMIPVRECPMGAGGTIHSKHPWTEIMGLSQQEKRWRCEGRKTALFVCRCGHIKTYHARGLFCLRITNGMFCKCQRYVGPST